MALSVYDAVIGSYDDDGGALAQAWAIAEQQRQGDCDKNKLRLYAALLIDVETSSVDGGYLALGGRTYGSRIKIINGKPENITTSLWGNYGWSTWCYTMEDVIKEAIASNSRGPTKEVNEQSTIKWLIMELDIQLNKMTYLLMKVYVTTGKERNNINSLRLLHQTGDLSRRSMSDPYPDPLYQKPHQPHKQTQCSLFQNKKQCHQPHMGRKRW